MTEPTNLRGLVFPGRRYRNNKTGRHCRVAEVYRIDGIWLVDVTYDHSGREAQWRISNFVKTFTLLAPVAGGDAMP